MNIALVDLNLLIVFDAVMREKHVTRAAKRIGMTQPAVSNALNRLRYIAKDDLFIRSAIGVVPTARAIELGPPIRQAINLVENAFDPKSFDPKISFKRCIARTTEYNSDELIVNELRLSFLARIDAYDFNKSYKVALYVILYLMLIPSVEPP